MIADCQKGRDPLTSDEAIDLARPDDLVQSSSGPIVIFDLDGTLVNTLPLIYEAFDAALTPVLGHRMADDEVRSRFGPPDNMMIRMMVPEHEAEAAIARYVAVYDERHGDLVEPLPEMASLIDHFKAKGAYLAVVTGKSRNTALITLERLGLLDQFDVVWAGDDVERQKPHPEALLRVLAAVANSDALPVVMIGDSTADILAGKAVGARTIGVLWGSPDHDDLYGSGPDVVVDSVAGLAAELESLFDQEMASS